MITRLQSVLPSRRPHSKPSEQKYVIFVFEGDEITYWTGERTGWSYHRRDALQLLPWAVAHAELKIAKRTRPDRRVKMQLEDVVT